MLETQCKRRTNMMKGIQTDKTVPNNEAVTYLCKDPGVSIWWCSISSGSWAVFRQIEWREEIGQRLGDNSPKFRLEEMPTFSWWLSRWTKNCCLRTPNSRSKLLNSRFDLLTVRDHHHLCVWHDWHRRFILQSVPCNAVSWFRNAGYESFGFSKAQGHCGEIC